MLNYITQSSSNMDEEKQYEYVVAKIQEIYNFNPEDTDQFLQYREMIRHIIQMYQKSQEIDFDNYNEQ